MGSRHIRLLALGMLCLASTLSIAWADPPAPEDQKPDSPAADLAGDSCTPAPAEPAFGPAAVPLTAEQMSARIDHHIVAQWRAKGVTPGGIGRRCRILPPA